MSIRHSGIGMTSQRTRMRMVERLREQGITDERVLTVMNTIPRHLFVEEALASRAYDDVALPINFGQTISNPWTVARMTELLRANSNLGKVLEIGTGCGYQTAVLAQLAQEVYSIERIGPLLTRTRIRLRELRVSNAYLRHADGLLGFPEAAPFDGIMMTAVTTQVPESLLEQLMIGGRIVYPKGSRKQNLCVIEHTSQGFIETILDEVKFVPILSGVISK
ncbi:MULTISPECIES: protein-L-isoaspartate(D-aspartate) O-methyltransferase [unclassified Nitrosomonas]|uniref:protein-L-isoaspartate(D-aspartate) O-methyltransferase n=1 Tax=unclassified Nitrosomonas TaxID=2609265 RepID=UPI00089D7F0C|nr:MULTISPECIES: protein-L-isoaspartate(D-aspartate) O-methyltransferase [unclassified Nitrosomonas]MDV6345744.1 protein-L-isoaspartate(D-aspartate) O-methyltransferase [Nitrosomonas sp. Is37]SDY97757.1 protein-L-isoaspartate(D-aspartate) O-methyltransferase [Nitrosomonas sp. Nm33]